MDVNRKLIVRLGILKEITQSIKGMIVIINTEPVTEETIYVKDVLLEQMFYMYELQNDIINAMTENIANSAATRGII